MKKPTTPPPPQKTPPHPLRTTVRQAAPRGFRVGVHFLAFRHQRRQEAAGGCVRIHVVRPALVNVKHTLLVKTHDLETIQTNI